MHREKDMIRKESDNIEVIKYIINTKITGNVSVPEQIVFDAVKTQKERIIRLILSGLKSKIEVHES